jgi:hypothetical protein
MTPFAVINVAVYDIAADFFLPISFLNSNAFVGKISYVIGESRSEDRRK